MFGVHFSMHLFILNSPENNMHSHIKILLISIHLLELIFEIFKEKPREKLTFRWKKSKNVHFLQLFISTNF